MPSRLETGAAAFLIFLSCISGALGNYHGLTKMTDGWAWDEDHDDDGVDDYTHPHTCWRLLPLLLLPNEWRRLWRQHTPCSLLEDIKLAFSINDVMWETPSFFSSTNRLAWYAAFNNQYYCSCLHLTAASMSKISSVTTRTSTGRSRHHNRLHSFIIWWLVSCQAASPSFPWITSLEGLGLCCPEVRWW